MALWREASAFAPPPAPAAAPPRCLPPPAVAASTAPCHPDFRLASQCIAADALSALAAGATRLLRSPFASGDGVLDRSIGDSIGAQAAVRTGKQTYSNRQTASRSR